MRIRGAIHAVYGNPDLWLRPVELRGSGMAFCIDNGLMCHVPTPRGGVPGMTSDVESIIGEWETVTPKQVCDELARSI